MEENHMIGVYVSQIRFPDPDFYLCQPSVEGYLVDKGTGTCVKANSSTANLTSYASPFSLNHQETLKRTGPERWSKLLVIDKNFSDLNSEGKMLIFEVCKRAQRKNLQELETVRTALAFLIPLAPDGSSNTNQELKLQLYKIRKDCKISHQDCNIYHLYSEHKLKKAHGYLQVSVKGVVPTKVPRSSKGEDKSGKQEERCLTDGKPADPDLAPVKPAVKTWEWSRHPTQSCKVPNKIHKSLGLGKSGFSCLRFSGNGLLVAAASLSRILIYDAVTGAEVGTLASHMGFVYELDWSRDDRYLLSVSNDCRGIVWDVTEKTPYLILPHPTYVYCGKWLDGRDQIVTGGKDHLIRRWVKTRDRFDLAEEIAGHSGFVSSIAVQDDSVVISGDSTGSIMVRKLSDDGWHLVKKLSFPETSQKVIDAILIHSSRRRIVVSVRTRSSYLVDFVSGIILQTYKSALNTFARSVSCLTPCGSFLFSFCQNGDVRVWEVNTGKVFASYDNLFPVERLSELSGHIHYHPHDHMVGIVALVPNYPLLMLKYDVSKNDDGQKLGLTFYGKNTTNNWSSSLVLKKS